MEEEEEEKRPTEGAFLSIEMNVGNEDDVENHREKERQKGEKTM